MAKEGSFADSAFHKNLIIIDFCADLFCRKGMIAPVERVPLTIIAIGGTCGAQTAGIEQTSGESVDEFCFIRRENGWTVITIFAHPGHVDTPKTALPDIQPGIGKNIQFKSSGGLYFDNLSSFCFTLAKCNPAERHQLGRIADIALFLQFFQIQARHLFFFCFYDNSIVGNSFSGRYRKLFVLL